MIDEEYIIGRTISHLVNNCKIAKNKVTRPSKKCISYFGTDYFFSMERDNIDIEVERVDVEENEDFNNFLERTKSKEFWNKDFLDYFRRQKNKYRKYLENLRLELNGVGHYHFKAGLKTKSEDNAFFGVFYNMIRVANLYNDLRTRV